jgi:hypothetical protein
MKKTVLSLLLVASIVTVHAQKKSSSSSSDYQSAIGLRLSGTFGVSYKHFLSEKGALEGVAYLGSNTGVTVINALYEVHNGIDGADRLKWYYGGGLNAIMYSSKYFGTSGTYFGAVGCVGLDYKFDKAPINLSLDYQPYFGLTGGIGFVGTFYGGLAVRYTLK